MTDEVNVPEQQSDLSGLTPEQQQADQAAQQRYQESLLSQEERDQKALDRLNEEETSNNELIGGKFKSQDDLLKAYQELEKKLGQPKEDSNPAPKEDLTIPDGENNPEQTTSNEEDSPSGFSTAKYEQEFVDKGELSEASYQELADKGFTKQQVDAYIQGQKAYSESIKNSIYEAVGGQDSYSELVAWAGENIPNNILQEYNEAVQTLNQERIMQHLEYMYLKQQTSAPKQVRRLEGDSPGQGTQPFQNKLEWQKAQLNPLYGKNKVYTEQVDSKYLLARRKGLL